MRKGFIITADVLMAFTVLAIGTVIAIQVMDAGRIDPWREESLHKVGEDILIIMERVEISGNEDIIDVITASLVPTGENILEDFLNETLPSNLGAKVTINVYRDPNGDRIYTPRAFRPTYEVEVPAGGETNRTSYSKSVYQSINRNLPSTSEISLIEIKVWTVEE